MSEEKRREPRVPVRLEAEVRFSSWDVFQLLWTVNISRGGLNLEVVGEAPEVGGPLTVRIFLPKGAPLELHAVVRHVTMGQKNAPEDKTKHKLQVGVEFLDLDEEKRVAIEKTLAGKGGEITLKRKDPT